MANVWSAQKPFHYEFRILVANKPKITISSIKEIDC